MRCVQNLGRQKVLSKRVFKKAKKKPSEYLVTDSEIEIPEGFEDEIEGIPIETGSKSMVEEALETVDKTLGSKVGSETGLELDWDYIKKHPDFQKAIIEVLKDLKVLRLKGGKRITIGVDAIEDLRKGEFRKDLTKKAKGLKRKEAPTPFELEMEKLGES
jgi:hypothetical protein